MTWTVPRDWEGQVCVILGGGPSLRGFDASSLAGHRVVTINDSWRLAPWADIHYFADATWWSEQCVRNRASLDGSIRFQGQARKKPKWVKGGTPINGEPYIRCLRFTGQLGFDPDPQALRHGSNSGYQAIHLAAHLGAKRIVLLGYDLHVDGKQTHWHNAPRPADFAGLCRDSFLPCFDSLVQPLADRGIEVVNATPGSALMCWPHVALERALSPASHVEEERLLSPEQTIGGAIQVNG